MTKKYILVTGASGFIGSGLCPSLAASGFNVRAAQRIDVNTDWTEALRDVDTIVHLAARVHIMNGTGSCSIDDFRRVNVLATKHLAQMAAKAGVRRFIFISSVKVNGEASDLPYTENDLPRPQDAYGISKKEAEDALVSLSAQIGLEMVILRLPLVYGPGVRANFKNLIKMAGSGLPLPFKGVQNRRSFIYLGNLVDIITACITHPLAAGETFMVSDGHDLSLVDLMQMIASAENKKLVLFYLHPSILKGLCMMAGKKEEFQKLTGSLYVDSSKIRNLLGIAPRFSPREGIAQTVKYYKA